MFDNIRYLFENHEKKINIGGQPEYIIAGLGNPGREYQDTRHNSGFMVLDRLSQKLNTTVTQLKFKSLCGDAVIAGKRVLLIKPQTFMNVSGEAIKEAAAFYKIPLLKVIVIYDDISLPIGKIRVRPKGSDGGHNGIKSIIYLTATDVFPRVKVGVGQKPRPEYDLAAWVLSKFTKIETEQLSPALDTAVLAVEEIVIQDGTYEAMNKYNN